MKHASDARRGSNTLTATRAKTKDKAGHPPVIKQTDQKIFRLEVDSSVFEEIQNTLKLV